MNADRKDVAKALDLLLHMIRVLAEGGKPADVDIDRVAQLIEDIKVYK